MIGDEARAVLAGRVFGHVATIMGDGSPHVAPVWIGCEGDEVMFIKGDESIAARNLRRDPRVAISATAANDPYCVVALRGEVVDMRRGAIARAWLDATSRRYIGVDYPEGGDWPILMVVRPTRVRLERYRLDDVPSPS